MMYMGSILFGTSAGCSWGANGYEFTTGAVLFILAVWLTAEAWLAVRRYRREPPVETLDVLFPSKK
jgi:hypothetical protein